MRVIARVVRTLSTGAICVVVAITAGGCGDDSTTGEPGPNVSADPDPGGEETEASEGGYALPEAWPIDTFPTPPGYEISDDIGVTDTMASLTIFDADPPEILAFFREALPAEGYELVSETGNEEGLLVDPEGGFQEFTGNGISVSILADDITFITLRVT